MYNLQVSVAVEGGGGIAQWSPVRAPAAKAGGPGFDPWWLPCFFFSLPAGSVTNVDGMKDLWCSSTVWLLSTQI